MKIGYIRVSTTMQNIASQMEKLKKEGIEKFFIDKSTGKNIDRQQFKEMLDFVREGDVIYCYDFSRISRNLKDLLLTIEDLKSKGVYIVSLEEGLDTRSDMAMFFVQVLGAAHQFLLTLQREKQLDGIEEAKKAGVYKGRKPISIENFEQYYTQWKNREVSKVQLAKNLNISRQTLYNLFAEFEETHAITEQTQPT